MRFRRIKIGAKSLVPIIASFRSFHKDKMNRKFSLSGLGQHFPVYVSLIMGNINAMHLKTRGHTYTVCFKAIARLPAIRVRTDKEIKESGKE